MIVTKKYIKNLREKAFLNISKEMEETILYMFGKNPQSVDGECYDYTEQDIYEQIRKLIRTE